MRLSCGSRSASPTAPGKNQLWLYIPSVSSGRIRFEWLWFREVLKKNVADSLSLVALASDGLVSDPPMPPAAGAAATEVTLAERAFEPGDE